MSLNLVSNTIARQVAPLTPELDVVESNDNQQFNIAAVPAASHSNTLRKLSDQLDAVTGRGNNTNGDLSEKPTDVKSAQAVTPVKLKTIYDFTLKNVSKGDVERLKKALDYLQRKDSNGNFVSPTAVKLLSRLKKGVTIIFNPIKVDSARAITQEVVWDSKCAIYNPGTHKLTSPALALAHEFGHLIDGIPANEQKTDPDYDNNEERRVIEQYETPIARELGEAPRRDHKGSRIHVVSPTLHDDMTRQPNKLTSFNTMKTLIGKMGVNG